MLKKPKEWTPWELAQEVVAAFNYIHSGADNHWVQNTLMPALKQHRIGLIDLRELKYITARQEAADAFVEHFAACQNKCSLEEMCGEAYKLYEVLSVGEQEKEKV